jgi:branched-chain amino acid transport system substrate-binding protein
VFAFAPDNQEVLPIRDVYAKSHSGTGSWGIAAAQSAYQTLLALRILERAVAKVGKDKVTGEAMYEAMLSSTFTEAELLGALPDIKFDKTAPFPAGKIAVKAQVVRDGKIVPLGSDWMPIPDLPKW